MAAGTPKCDMSISHLAMEKVDVVHSHLPTYDAANLFPGGAVADSFSASDLKTLEKRAEKVSVCEQFYATQAAAKPTFKPTFAPSSSGALRKFR